jgi:hypothetical protein
MSFLLPPPSQKRSNGTIHDAAQEEGKIQQEEE